MITNTRTFLREFAAIKARARGGETVRIKDRGGEYLFTAGSPTKCSLLGVARGRIRTQADLTQPTLGESDWKPGL